MATITLSCFECGAKLEFQDQIGRRDECSKCGADVRVCKNCEFYDPKVYNECRETSADPVREKQRSNLCDFFRPRSKDGSGSASADALKAAAEALFKK
jgi:hypothetical protein